MAQSTPPADPKHPSPQWLRPVSQSSRSSASADPDRSANSPRQAPDPRPGKSFESPPHCHAASQTPDAVSHRSPERQPTKLHTHHHGEAKAKADRQPIAVSPAPAKSNRPFPIAPSTPPYPLQSASSHFQAYNTLRH